MADAAKMRVQAAMLDSLISTFKYLDGTGQFMLSMNPKDVVEMLTDLRSEFDESRRIKPAT